MQQWEYKTLKILTHGFIGGQIKEDDLEIQFNELGEEGWEIVSCVNTNQSGGASFSIIVVMKRPKEA